MAASPSFLLLPIDSGSVRSLSASRHGGPCDKVRGFTVQCSNFELSVRASRARDQFKDVIGSIKRRDVLGLVFGLSSMLAHSSDAKGAGLPPEEKPRLWDDVCEKELENVCSLEKGQLYIFRVGSSKVIKGLNEGILSTKIGGKRRLYIPGSDALNFILEEMK